MKKIKLIKITLLIIILVEEIRSVNLQLVNINRLIELEKFEEEYNKLVNYLHPKIDDTL